MSKVTRAQGSPQLWLAALRSEGVAMRAAFEEAAASEAGLGAPVPSCPDWTVRDLVRHVGTVYRRIRTIVGQGGTNQPETTFQEFVAALDFDDEAPVAWCAEEHRALLELLDGTDPQHPAWNWAPAAKQVAFWQRRMAHETAVHRWDAQTAVGQVEPIEARLAADGVAEVLDTFLPAGRRRVPEDRTGVAELVATDTDHRWYVRLRGAGVALLDTDTLLDHDDHHPRGLAQGTASDLDLALWGRVPFDVLDISGDPALLDALRTG